MNIQVISLVLLVAVIALSGCISKPQASMVSSADLRSTKSVVSESVVAETQVIKPLSKQEINKIKLLKLEISNANSNKDRSEKWVGRLGQLQ